jgi:hypothetical protein
MRELADADRIRRFMQALGREADADGACYFTGGATAVLVGWRDSTIDVDVRFEPESDRLLRAMIERELVQPRRALSYFEEIEHQLYRFPAVDPGAFRRRVEEAFRRP